MVASREAKAGIFDTWDGGRASCPLRRDCLWVMRYNGVLDMIRFTR